MARQLINTAVNTFLDKNTNAAYQELESVSKHPRAASAKTLRSILTEYKDTVYGTEHNFSKIIEASDDEELFRLYQENVKVNTYEEFKPYIDRMANGEKDVLIKGKPIRYLTTSGTTGEPKYLPCTKKYSEIFHELLMMQMSGWAHINHSAFKGKVLSIGSPSTEGFTPDGTPAGSASGMNNESSGKLQFMTACPFEVFEIKDYAVRYYVMMRLAIEQEVRVLVAPNPSTILEIQKVVDKHYDKFCDDIENGTISVDIDLPEDIIKKINKGIKPNPERAKELRELKKTAYEGRPVFSDYWSHLRILSTWKCGNTRYYAEQFKNWIPLQCQHIEVGYFASECRFGITMRGSDSTVLFPHKTFLEFIAEEDFDSDHPHFYLLDELKPGKRYCPLITTWNGLYRYNMNDLVECGPRYMNSPTISMVQKINGLISMTGEKLHENQYIQAVNQAKTKLDIDVPFFMGFANLKESRYEFYYELPGDITNEKMEELNKLVDENLHSLNIEYESKRKSMRINDPVAHRLVKNAYEELKKELVSQGRRDGQFKLTMLNQNEELREVLSHYEI